jgi:hypothetical protein
LLRANAKQNPGVTLTLSSQTLSGIAISTGTAALAGDLVIDISTLDVYNGMQLTLVNSTSLSGSWENVSLVGTSSECTQTSVDISYTATSSVATFVIVPLCTHASQHTALFVSWAFE